MTDQIKFKYDIQNGTIEYEGAHGLLKPTLKSLAKVLNGGGAKAKPKAKAKTIKATKEPSAPSKPKKGKGGYKPKYNTDLDLLKLQGFIDNLVLKNNTEYVVAFTIFLTERLKLDSISGDDIYTCFLELKAKLKMPKNVANAFKNAQNIDHVIQYETGFTNITLPAKGSNLYHHEIIKREQAEK